jgi:hypothetical protein
VVNGTGCGSTDRLNIYASTEKFMLHAIPDDQRAAQHSYSWQSDLLAHRTSLIGLTSQQADITALLARLSRQS